MACIQGFIGGGSGGKGSPPPPAHPPTTPAAPPPATDMGACSAAAGVGAVTVATAVAVEAEPAAMPLERALGVQISHLPRGTWCLHLHSLHALLCLSCMQMALRRGRAWQRERAQMGEAVGARGPSKKGRKPRCLQQVIFSKLSSASLSSATAHTFGPEKAEDVCNHGQTAGKTADVYVTYIRVCM